MTQFLRELRARSSAALTAVSAVIHYRCTSSHPTHVKNKRNRLLRDLFLLFCILTIKQIFSRFLYGLKFTCLNHAKGVDAIRPRRNRINAQHCMASSRRRYTFGGAIRLTAIPYTLTRDYIPSLRLE